MGPERDEGEGTAASLIPSEKNLPEVKRAAAHCRACPLWERGTQTVFGEGAASSRVMFVGEQPGDAEDREGRPFVGPAGRVLDRGLEAAGIDRNHVYVTNVVKHFKWIARGKRRLHDKPNAREIAACMPWLEAEINVVKPRVIVAMGVTAAEALAGKNVRVMRDRGKLIRGPRAPYITVTVHPSSILRAPSDEERRAAMEAFAEDLRVVAEALSKPPSDATE